MSVILRETRNAERVMNEDLVVALRDAHRGENRAGRVRTHQQVDLVDGNQLLIECARQIRFRLVVLDHPFDRTPEKPVFLVDLLDKDVAHQLMNNSGGSERAGQRKRTADPDRRSGRRCECTAAIQDDSNKQRDPCRSVATNDAHLDSSCECIVLRTAPL